MGDNRKQNSNRRELYNRGEGFVLVNALHLRKITRNEASFLPDRKTPVGPLLFSYFKEPTTGYDITRLGALHQLPSLMPQDRLMLHLHCMQPLLSGIRGKGIRS